MKKVLNTSIRELRLELEKLRAKFRVERKMSKAEKIKYNDYFDGTSEPRLHLNKTAMMIADPIPKSAEEAMRLFLNYYVKDELISLKMTYLHTTNTEGKKALQEFLQPLRYFIDKAKNVKYLDAVNWINGVPSKKAGRQKQLYYIFKLWTTDKGVFFKTFKHLQQYCFAGSRHVQLYAKYVLFYAFLVGIESSIKKKAKEQLRKRDKQTLEAIWRKGKKHYEKTISFLAKQNSHIGDSFIVYNTNRQLHWNKFRGHIQYLAGFISVCQEKEFIESVSSTHYVELLSETFNIKCNPKPFKLDELKKIKAKYRLPFLQLSSNN